MNFIKKLIKAVIAVADNIFNFAFGPFIKVATQNNINYFATSFSVLIRVVFALSYFVTVPSFLLSVSTVFLQLSLLLCAIRCIGQFIMIMKGLDVSKMSFTIDTRQGFEV
jgi:hypothetical protein